MKSCQWEVPFCHSSVAMKNILYATWEDTEVRLCNAAISPLYIIGMLEILQKQGLNTQFMAVLNVENDGQQKHFGVPRSCTKPIGFLTSGFSGLLLHPDCSC